MAVASVFLTRCSNSLMSFLFFASCRFFSVTFCRVPTPLMATPFSKRKLPRARTHRIGEPSAGNIRNVTSTAPVPDGSSAASSCWAGISASSGCERESNFSNVIRSSWGRPNNSRTRWSKYVAWVAASISHTPTLAASSARRCRSALASSMAKARWPADTVSLALVSLTVTEHKREWTI